MPIRATAISEARILSADHHVKETNTLVVSTAMCKNSIGVLLC
jgi:hypothetical protein